MRNNNNDIITIVTYCVVLNLHNTVPVSFWKNLEGSLSSCEEFLCVLNQMRYLGLVCVGFFDSLLLFVVLLISLWLTLSGASKTTFGQVHLTQLFKLKLRNNNNESSVW